MRICNSLATQASPTLKTYNAVYGPWNNKRFVHWCVCELQGDGKFPVQLSVVGFVLECVSESVYSTPG